MKQYRIWCLTILVMLTCSVQGRVEDISSTSRILKDLRHLNFSEQKIEEFFESAEFLNDTQVVSNLLDYLQQVDTVDEMYLVRMVLRRMTCQPERVILERIHAEKTPQQKAKLIMILMDFYGEDVLLVLVEQLDDTRQIACEHCGTRRICDTAYMTLIFQLEQ